MLKAFHPAQRQIVTDKHRFRVLCCGRRFGKTTLAIEEIKACAANKNAQVVYIAPTYQQARDIAWTQLRAECQLAATSINESRLEIRLPNIFGGESFIALRGWEAIETLRGQAFDLIVLDEVASMRNFWLHWEEVIRPTLTDRKGEVLFISTPKGFNHFYELYNKETGIGWDTGPDTDFKSFHFSTYDNPFIPVEEIEKAKKELLPERFAQEYMADFKKTEGLVYKEFDRNVHVYDELPSDIHVVERIAGVDFGFTNPSAIMDIRIDSTDCWWVEADNYRTGRSDFEVAEFVAAERFMMVYPDPEAAGGVAEMRKMRCNVRDVIKGKNSIKHGIDAVRERLRANKLKIKHTCVNTILEFETYSYPDKKDLHNEDENPIKENDHAMDALRYPIMMRARRNAHATVQYPTNLAPRNNLIPFQQMQGLPPELQDNKPRFAHTHVPRL